MPVKLPDSINILHREYALKIRTYEENAQEPVFGKIEFATPVISYIPRTFPSDEVEVVIHESLHGLWEAFDLGLIEHEEHIVKTLAHGITTMIMDNPVLFSTFEKMIHGVSVDSPSER